MNQKFIVYLAEVPGSIPATSQLCSMKVQTQDKNELNKRSVGTVIYHPAIFIGSAPAAHIEMTESGSDGKSYDFPGSRLVVFYRAALLSTLLSHRLIYSAPIKNWVH